MLVGVQSQYWLLDQVGNCFSVYRSHGISH